MAAVNRVVMRGRGWQQGRGAPGPLPCPALALPCPCPGSTTSPDVPREAPTAPSTPLKYNVCFPLTPPIPLLPHDPPQVLRLAFVVLPLEAWMEALSLSNNISSFSSFPSSYSSIFLLLLFVLFFPHFLFQSLNHPCPCLSLYSHRTACSYSSHSCSQPCPLYTLLFLLLILFSCSFFSLLFCSSSLSSSLVCLTSCRARRCVCEVCHRCKP